jgi:glutathione reductase (NADPH)
MSADWQVDLLVLGAGSGGIAAAVRAARLGARVAVMDAGPVGGVCVNAGCVPKKVMWEAARMQAGFARAQAFGFGFPTPPVLDWPALVAARTAYIGRIQASYRHHFDKAGVEWIQAHGQLLGGDRVRTGDGRVISARHILLATGGRPDRPDIDGAQWLQTSDDFFGWQHLPPRVAIVGGGYIGVELAGLLQALGSEVHLLVRGTRLLPGFDTELVAALTEQMRGHGIGIHLGARLHGLHGGGDALQLHGEGPLPAGTFNAVLAATGRKPNTPGIGLDVAGVECGPRGHVCTDADTLATSAARIWAVGDVTDQPALTPVAVAQGRRLAEQLFGGNPAPMIDFEQVPSVVFSHPPLGKVGLDEEQARKRYEQVHVYRSSFVPLAEAMAGGQQRSLFKLVCVGSEQRVAGVHLLGESCDEILQGFALAVRCGLTREQFEQTLPIHPTSAEEVLLSR